MLKNKITRLIAVVMAFAMTMAIAGCGKEPHETESSENKAATYTVTLENKGGTALPKCSAEVYADASKATLIYKGITNAEGMVTFTAPVSDGYVAVLSKIPDGYAVADSYKLTGENTTIVLEPGVMSDEDFDSMEYFLGDAVLDFMVTAPDGTSYVLSELLQEKKAVVLNFWYLNCQPCKMEFPYLQEAYEQLGDEIEVLALNPCDGDDTQVAGFKADNGYTFPMMKCDARWQQMMKLEYYPTTVVIDRYGNICLIHQGMVTDTQTFLNMFGYFVSDEYKQTFVESLSQLPVYNAQ